MRIISQISFLLGASLVFTNLGCAKKDSTSTASNTSDGAGSEIATSVVSGEINNASGTNLGAIEPHLFRKNESGLAVLLDEINPLRSAYAATWSCSGGTLMPVYSGAGAYAFTPMSCSITWGNGKSASSTWTGNYSLVYSGAGCSSFLARIGSQNANCSITRTTPSTGITRSLTGPDGNSYSVTHNTHGSGTGYDSAASPVPSNDGASLTCGSDGCGSSFTIHVQGSHLTGTVTTSKGSSTLWDHTVVTGTDGVTISGTGTNRIVSGTVIVQHNLAKFTSTSTFNNVGYGSSTCCFPTSGNVTTVFSGGPNASKTETLTFSNTCGEATLTQPDGTTTSLTLQHCI